MLDMDDAARPAYRLRPSNAGSDMATIEHITSSDAKASRRGEPRGLQLLRRTPRYFAIWRRFRASTLLGRDAYLVNLYLADKHLSNPRLAEGCIVECGTWRGGMAAGLSVIGGPDRDYHFFDSFEGLPPGRGRGWRRRQMVAGASRRDDLYK
jgi:hypothetical protein